jgi:hypothetical protein
MIPGALACSRCWRGQRLESCLKFVRNHRDSGEFLLIPSAIQSGNCGKGGTRLAPGSSPKRFRQSGRSRAIPGEPGWRPARARWRIKPFTIATTPCPSGRKAPENAKARPRLAPCVSSAPGRGVDSCKRKGKSGSRQGRPRPPVGKPIKVMHVPAFAHVCCAFVASFRKASCCDIYYGLLKPQWT